MGFDLFMTVAAIVAAAVATWAILRLFLSENDDIAPSHQRITDDKPAKNHTENHTLDTMFYSCCSPTNLLICDAI